MKSKINQFVRIKYSKIHGNGGFAKKDIKKGTKLIEYIGKKITKEEAETISDKNGVFLFEVNKKWDIDGNIPENSARFINLSCDPNCNFEIKNNKIWIKAKRDIKKGEELSYNYGFDLEGHKKYPCRCGTKNCVGFILDKDHWNKIKAKWIIQHLGQKDEYHTRRWKDHYTDKEYFETNKYLRSELNKLIKKGKMKKAKDYYTAGIILHHAFNLALSKKALRYAKLSVKKGYKPAKTLIAQATDRLLQLQGKPQKFGTQATELKNGKWKLYPIDGTITDKERKAYGLPTLKYLKEYLNK